MISRLRTPFSNSVALALAAVVPLAIAIAHPFLELSVGSLRAKSTVPDAAFGLWDAGYPILCVLVLTLTIVLPSPRIAGLLYVVGPLVTRQQPWPAAWLVFRTTKQLSTWSMLDVFFVGVLVAVVKLADMATVVPRVGLIAFMVLMALTFLAYALLDEEAVWRRVSAGRSLVE